MARRKSSTVVSIPHTPPVKNESSTKQDECCGDKKKTVGSECEAILKKFGVESNIPINHDYWDLRNRPPNDPV